MPHKLNKRIAIIGAGAGGCCSALELARRGYNVSLYERGSVAVGEASFNNEGKIHLGFIYAMDDSLRTARQMIDGALIFESHLQRWMDYRAADAISTPFLYGVHQGSLMKTEALLTHYRACGDYYRTRSAELQLDYLGVGTGFEFQLLEEGEYPGGINPELIPTLIQTTEYAVDPRVVAISLRDAIDHHPAIEFYPAHTVTSIDFAKGSGYRVDYSSSDGANTENFSQVVNSTWFRRLPLDKTMGIKPPGPWSHRYKFANRVSVGLSPEQLPSITCVQGPFGDLVNFGDLGFFMSWYPIGRTGMSSEEVPPQWSEMYDREARMDIFRRSMAQWNRRCSNLAKLEIADEAVDPAGGVIYALGTADVDSPSSRLHDRYEIGIQSRGGYHSVDTGKYTLAPLIGVAVADRVCGYS